MEFVVHGPAGENEVDRISSGRRNSSVVRLMPVNRTDSTVPHEPVWCRCRATPASSASHSRRNTGSHGAARFTVAQPRVSPWCGDDWNDRRAAPAYGPEYPAGHPASNSQHGVCSPARIARLTFLPEAAAAASHWSRRLQPAGVGESHSNTPGAGSIALQSCTRVMPSTPGSPSACISCGASAGLFSVATSSE